MLNPIHMADYITASMTSSLQLQALVAARKLYNRASIHGLLRRTWAALRGCSYRLRILSEAAPGAFPTAGKVSQLMQVPVREIVGSEDRDHDFDTHFLPLQPHIRERWINVAVAWYSCQPLPPVQLIAVGDAYYVRDGHHRVSVARMFGAHTIDAEVVVWQAAAASMSVTPAPAALLSHS